MKEATSPGPWRWTDDIPPRLLDANAAEVMGLGTEGDNGEDVAGWGPEETDARLIASAPALLAALKGMLSLPNCTCEDCTPYVDAARAAIAEAEGA